MIHPSDDQIHGLIVKLADSDGWVPMSVLREALGNFPDGFCGFNLHSALFRLARAGRVERTAPWIIPHQVRAVNLTPTDTKDNL